MEALVMDTNFNSIGILDSYESFIWTDRFNRCGDFEVYVKASEQARALLRKDCYLWRKDSNHVMIIDKSQISTDVEDGKHLTITGESLESILKRRIVWKQTNLDGSIQNGVLQLLNENIISPTDPDRKIDNFIFVSNDDVFLNETQLTAQYTGDNLYDVICEICDAYGIGFEITLTDNNEFAFKLLCGEDRTYAQNNNTFVIFSFDFDNIINSEYMESTRYEKNVTLVAGEGEGVSRRTATVGSAKGLSRKELFTDARDISSDIDYNVQMPDEEYIKLLQQRGEETLAENRKTHVYDGEMFTNQMYVYGADYFLGDIVQLSNEYGDEPRAVIKEMIYSSNSSGFSCYPTFEILDNEEEGLV